jgi:hypothetical protein
MIAMTRSSLQALITSTNGQFVAFICKGRGASRSPYTDSNSGSLISSLMVSERNSRSLDNDSATYVVSDDATTDILSSI